MKTKNTLILRIALGVALVLLAALSALPMIPPRAVPADAPAARFSAERAMADLEVVASQPHGAGSKAQGLVRDYLVGQVQALGLEAQIDTSAPLSNILVRLPGTDSTQTVLVTGHYDSHPPAPGAGDNGISVAAMLEAIRVLHARPTLRNDVLFLFTDGEELGWKGAQDFINQYPAAKKETGVVLVFDTVPGSAPLMLSETSPGDDWLVRQISFRPLSTWAGSWNNIEERTELDTDFDIFQAAGFSGLVFMNETSGTRYHTTRDSVDAISPQLMQSVGQTMLALANRFGTIDLHTRSQGPDRIFFSVPLLGIVSHPAWLMPILSGLAILALVSFVIVAWHRRLFSLGRFGLSLLGLLLGIGLVVLCAQFAWGGVKDSYAAGLAAGNGFEASAAWQTGFMIGAAILMVIILSLLSRLLGGASLAPAAILVYLAIGFVFYFLADGNQPLTTAWLAWPLIGGVAGMGVLVFAKNPVWKVVLLAICALAILTLMIPYLWLGSYTREDAWLPVLVTCVAVILFAPQAEAVFGRALS